MERGERLTANEAKSVGGTPVTNLELDPFRAWLYQTWSNETPRPSLEDGRPDQPSPPLLPLTQHTSRLDDTDGMRGLETTTSCRPFGIGTAGLSFSESRGQPQSSESDPNRRRFIGVPLPQRRDLPIPHQLSSSTPRISTTSAEDALATSLIFTKINPQKLQGPNNFTTYFG